MRPVRRQGRPPPGPLTTDELRAALGDPVLDPELLQRALTHRSFAYENGQIPTNERLEFLGDSVLGLAVTVRLFTGHPDLDDETSLLEEDLLDLEPLLRDAVVLALPFQPLCMDDCPGLCTECGARLADDPDHSHDAPIDPRWAGLQQIQQDTQD